jgi:multisubunit Na+/H+ antiporter MnhF subunit
MVNIIFRNNTMIRILAIELLNRILILIILMIKSLLKKLMVCLDNFSALFSVSWLEQG